MIYVARMCYITMYSPCALLMINSHKLNSAYFYSCKLKFENILAFYASDAISSVTCVRSMAYCLSRIRNRISTAIDSNEDVLKVFVNQRIVKGRKRA